MNEIYVKGYIQINNNPKSRVSFSCDTEQGFWIQWGNTTKALSRTVDITTKIQEAINNSELVNDLEIIDGGD